MIIKDEINRLTRHKAASEAKHQKLKLNNPELASHYKKLIDDYSILINKLQLLNIKEDLK
jgi:hypothetical protein